MKKIISVILAVAMLLSISTVAYAQPKEKLTKPTSFITTKVNTIKNKILDRSKSVLIGKCNFSVSQLEKLKGYIDSAKLGLTSSDAIIVEAKSKIDSAIKLINDSVAHNNINSYIERINAATTSKELRDISKELQKSWMTNQNFIKRITGLASAARLNKAYDQTKTLVDSIGTGIDAIGTDAASALKKAEFKEDYDEIVIALEEAHDEYLAAVRLYSSLILDSVKADKNFKDAHAKLMEAKDGLHDVLVQTKQLLVKIKNVNNIDDDDDKLEADDDKDDVEEDDD